MTPRPRVLALSSIAPWQPAHGASLRIAGLLGACRRVWDVRLCCLTTPAFDTPPPAWQDITAGVTVVDRLGADWPRVALPALLARARSVAGAWAPDVVVTWLGPHVGALKQLGVPVVGDLIDCRTYAEVAEWQRSAVRSPLAGARRLAGAALSEARAVRRLDHCLAAGRRDAQALSLLGARRVSLLLNGVDPRPCLPLPDTPGLIFSGNLNFFPNVEAIRWFAARVWPRVVHARPDVRLRIVGRNPEAAVRALALQPGIDVHEDVPDMSAALAQSWIALAPMRAGSGVKNKVLEAWASGRAAVMTHRAVNGLQLPASSRGLVVSRPEAMSDLLLSLLDTPDEVARLGREAQAHARTHYSWEAVSAPLLAAVDRLARSPTGGDAAPSGGFA